MAKSSEFILVQLLRTAQRTKTKGQYFKYQFNCYFSTINLLVYIQVTDQIKPYVQDPLAYDILEKFLTLDPERRINADSALNHDFFWTNPMPCTLSRVLSQLEISNYEYMIRYRKPQSSIIRP